MNLPRVSGSVDVVVLGGAIAVVGYALDSWLGAALGVAILALGVVKVVYDHLTGFEDPLGIEGFADRSDDVESLGGDRSDE